MKRTFQPSNRKKKNKHGFRKRMSTKSGRNIIKRRRKKGRKKLSAQELVTEYNYRLPKSEILKSRRAFRQLFSSGKRIKGSIGQLIYLPNDSKKVAFVVGKRVGSSVTRNKLKRRMREVYRHHKNAVPGGIMVLFQLFQQNNIPDYQAIESEFLKLCSKL